MLSDRYPTCIYSKYISNYRISQVLFLSTKASLPPRKNSKYHFRLQGPIPIKRTTNSVEFSSIKDQEPRGPEEDTGVKGQPTINLTEQKGLEYHHKGNWNHQTQEMAGVS